MLDADSLSLLRKLAAHRQAVVRLKDLPRVLGLAEGEAAAALAELLALDLVVLWSDAACGPAVIISTTGAARAGVVLECEDGKKPSTWRGTAGWRWVPAGSVKSERAAALTFSDLDGPDGGKWSPESRADPKAVDPRQAAGSTAEKHVLLLGLRPSWPEALDEPVCPCHPPGPLPAMTYCLACDCRPERKKRLAALKASERAKLAPKRKPRKKKAKALAGGVGRAVRS